MADDVGVFKWEMASRIILKGLPGVERSGYAKLRNPEAINPYGWNVLYLEPVIKRIHYRSGKADKRVTIDVTSTAWNKIHCHSTAAGVRPLPFLLTGINGRRCCAHAPWPGLVSSRHRKSSWRDHLQLPFSPDLLHKRICNAVEAVAHPHQQIFGQQFVDNRLNLFNSYRSSDCFAIGRCSLR